MHDRISTLNSMSGRFAKSTHITSWSENGSFFTLDKDSNPVRDLGSWRAGDSNHILIGHIYTMKIYSCQQETKYFFILNDLLNTHETWSLHNVHSLHSLCVCVSISLSVCLSVSLVSLLTRLWAKSVIFFHLQLGARAE